MPDDEPSQQAPPADPFGPLHVGCVQALELFRGLRAAGAGLVEAAILTGGIIATSGPAASDKGTGQP